MHMLTSTQFPLITPTMGQLSGIHLLNKTILFDQFKLYMSKIHHLFILNTYPYMQGGL